MHSKYFTVANFDRISACGAVHYHYHYHKILFSLTLKYYSYQFSTFYHNMLGNN